MLQERKSEAGLDPWKAHLRSALNVMFGHHIPNLFGVRIERHRQRIYVLPNSILPSGVQALITGIIWSPDRDPTTVVLNVSRLHTLGWVRAVVVNDAPDFLDTVTDVDPLLTNSQGSPLFYELTRRWVISKANDATIADPSHSFVDGA
jgi:hypothetical protein